jgi:three-Cys-motif partner protein
MAAPKSIIWTLDRHTQAKHEILRRYLGAWLPILINHCHCARIVDGFAGPGIYENGEIGSPLIALQALLTHPDSKVQQTIHQGKTELIFIEKDRRRSHYLQNLFEQQKVQLSCPPQLQPRIITGTFLTEIDNILTIMEQQKNLGAALPTFFFIDPFGFSHTPMHIIKRIMQLPMCEVVITFMYEEVNRFLTANYHTKDQTYDELFGTTAWRAIAQDSTLSASEREKRLHDLYHRQLLTTTGATYVRSFCMLNRHNATDYFLFFATRSRKGVEAMKRAMWKVDPTGAFQFSDYSNPYQPLLLLEKPNYTDLQRILLARFKGQEVGIDEIEEYVLAETPYITFKRECLAPLEAASPPCLVVRCIDPTYKRRKGSFPEEKVRIKFL